MFHTCQFKCGIITDAKAKNRVQQVKIIKLIKI